MNEQNNKKIFFNKSTLISLKAELLRKQEEVNEKKQLPHNRIENFKPPPPKPSEKNNDVPNTKKSFQDSLQAIDTEELEAYKKSKAALEKKAELYKHLSDSAGNSQLAGHFLVDFNSKKQQEAPKECSLSPEPEIREEDEENSEWTEFTDCLGRTRKCLKTDLELYKDRDKELMRIMNKNQGDNAVHDSEEIKSSEKPLLVQTTNAFLQSLRAKWEEKERDLLSKDKDIHYQDVLFDEARMHGVAYYSFSTDEAERRKQMEELIKQRDETLKAQKESEEKRKKRDELIAARVAAARARQRMRAGLPPEDPEEQNRKDFTTCLLEFLTQQKNEAEAKAKDEETKLREEKEKERQKLRETYVREWDVGKDGVNEKKRFREMSQEEYVEQQRAKRDNEFAPPQTATSSKSDTFDIKGRKVTSTDSPATSKSWTDVRPKPRTPPPPDISDYQEQKGLYFSTAKNTFVAKDLYRHFVKPQEPTPIINEVEDDSTKLDERNENLYRHPRENDSEIAPPPTYDYYGPVAKRSRQHDQNPFQSDLREAYEQGVKNLHKGPSNRKLSQVYDFSME